LHRRTPRMHRRLRLERRRPALAAHHRHPAGPHDPADHHQRQPRGVPPGPAHAPGGGPGPRRHALGGHPHVGAALRPLRRHLRVDAGPRPRARRDHGRGHGPVAVLRHQPQPARHRRRHLRPEHRQQVQRGQRDGPGRPDRLRHGAVRHHPAGQRRGAAVHRPPQGVLGGQRMSHATLTPERSSLRGATLPKWFPWAVACASAALGYGISAAAGLRSDIQWALIAAVLFVAGSYAVAAKVEGVRQAKDRTATSLVWVAFLLAVIPLASLLWETVKQGVKVLDVYFLTHSMGTVADAETGGGIYHAMLGTLQQVGLAALISVPVGVLTAVYLVEYGRGRLAQAVTFFVDVMTGIPSIVAGLFILSLWVLILGMGPSGFAGSMALSILMI